MISFLECTIKDLSVIYRKFRFISFWEIELLFFSILTVVYLLKQYLYDIFLWYVDFNWIWNLSQAAWQFMTTILQNFREIAVSFINLFEFLQKGNGHTPLLMFLIGMLQGFYFVI